MNARMGTQPYPCGEWHGDNGSTFRISADGSYEQKRSSSISTVVVHQPSKNGDVSKIRAIQRNGNHKVDLILLENQSISQPLILRSSSFSWAT